MFRSRFLSSTSSSTVSKTALLGFLSTTRRNISFLSCTKIHLCSSSGNNDSTFSDLEASINQQQQQRHRNNNQRQNFNHHHGKSNHNNNNNRRGNNSNIIESNRRRDRDDRNNNNKTQFQKRTSSYHRDQNQSGNNNNNRNRERDAYRQQRQEQHSNNDSSGNKRPSNHSNNNRQTDQQQQRSSSPLPPKSSSSTPAPQPPPTTSTTTAPPVDVNQNQIQQQQQTQNSSSSTSATNQIQPLNQQPPDVRQLELRLRQAHERLDRVLERIKSSSNVVSTNSSSSTTSPIASLADSNLASVPPPIFGSSREVFLSSQENPFIEQFFEADDEVVPELNKNNNNTPQDENNGENKSSYDISFEQQKQRSNSKLIALGGKDKDVSFSRTEFGIARAELVGVVAEPIKVMQDTLLNRNFVRIIMRIVNHHGTASKQQQQEKKNDEEEETSNEKKKIDTNNNVLMFEVRCYGEALLRACLDGGIQDPSSTHTILHVSGKMMKSDGGEMVIAASEEYGTLSIIVADPK